MSIMSPHYNLCPAVKMYHRHRRMRFNSVSNKRLLTCKKIFTYLFDYLMRILLRQCCVQIESGKALDADGGFTVDSLHEQGFTAIFLGIGKLSSSRSTVVARLNVVSCSITSSPDSFTTVSYTHLTLPTNREV